MIMNSNQDTLTNLAIKYLWTGDLVRAAQLFEKLQPPIPPLAALNWAAVLAHKRKFSEALQILSRIDKSIKKKSRDELRDLGTCFLFEDILQMISTNQYIKSSKLRSEIRLVTLMAPCISMLLGLFRILGSLSIKFGFSGGHIIQKLVDSFRTQSWANGFPIRPDFLEGELLIEQMKGYDLSYSVYRTILLEYLDYWISSCGNIRDLLLATVKGEDALALYCIVRKKQPSVILEIGTFIGFSTCMMTRPLKDNGKGTIHCIDPNLDYFSVNEPLSHARKMVNTLELDAWVRIHEGYFSEPRGTVESNVPVLGKRVSEIVPHIDLAFIDGDHMTTAVLQDFMLLLPSLKPQATVVFHDIRNWSSVRQAILTLFQDKIYEQRMRYFKVSPSGNDGIGLVEVDKEKPIIVKEGIDKWIFL